MAQTGSEWIIDAAGCDSRKLCDGDVLRSLCQRIIAELDLHVVGQPQWHQFASPGGWTGMYLLTESHLTIHTFPEHAQATLNLYCCRERKEWDWEAKLEGSLGATSVRVRMIERGDSNTPPNLKSEICNLQSQPAGAFR